MCLPTISDDSLHMLTIFPSQEFRSQVKLVPFPQPYPAESRDLSLYLDSLSREQVSGYLKSEKSLSCPAAYLLVEGGVRLLHMDAVNGDVWLLRGAGMRACAVGNDYFLLPEGGVLECSGREPETVPPGAWEVRFESTVQPFGKDASAREKSSSFNLAVPALAMRGRAWFLRANSTEPILSSDELEELFARLYRQIGTLGAFYGFRVFTSWADLTAAARKQARDVRRGLDAMSELWSRIDFDAPQLVPILRDPRLVSRKPDDACRRIESYFSFVADVGPERLLIPHQADVYRAWQLEESLLDQRYLGNRNAADALLSLWRGVGGFVPLADGNVLVRDRST